MKPIYDSERVKLYKRDIGFPIYSDTPYTEFRIKCNDTNFDKGMTTCRPLVSEKALRMLAEYIDNLPENDFLQFLSLSIDPDYIDFVLGALGVGEKQAGVSFDNSP